MVGIGPDGDENVYGPEGHALGEDGEVEVAEEKTGSLARPVVKNAVSRRQRRAGIPLACSVDSFTTVRKALRL